MADSFKRQEDVNAVVMGVTHSLKSEMAMRIVERWAMVCAEPDGEDSAGRAKLRLLSPELVVDRALAVSDLLVDRLADNGWITKPEMSLEDVQRRDGKLRRVALREEMRREA